MTPGGLPIQMGQIPQSQHLDDEPQVISGFWNRKNQLSPGTEQSNLK